jgi:hypothetical protein
MINQANSATLYFCNKHNYEVTVAEEECPICKAMRSISWEKIWDNYKDEPEQQLTIVRGSILAYQTGMVVRLATYIGLNENNPDKAKDVAMWRADLKAEISDVFAQAILLCLQQGLDWRDVMDMGKLRLRMKSVHQMLEQKDSRYG